jgi:acyl-coenzyme A synthetase/AMP-(fatty) acid ligase
VPKHLSMEANLVTVKIKSVCPNLLKYMDLYKTHGRVIIFHNYTVIQDVLATGGLKDIPLFCMKDRLLTNHSSNDNDTVLINKALNLTKALEITPDNVPKPVAVSSRDVLLNIFTSGTTGMPKAVIMSNSRFKNNNFHIFILLATMGF